MVREPKGTVVYETGFILVTFDMVPEPAVAAAYPTFFDESVEEPAKTPLLDFTEQVWEDARDTA